MAEKEFIEREAATAYAPLPKYLRDYQTMNLDDAWEDGYDFAIKQIEAIPAADVRPVVKATWEKVTEQHIFASTIMLWLVLLAENGETKAGGIVRTAALR